MLRHNNRGAGLVTVVVVLAVCGILLAGVLSLAYQHYKNVMLSENKTEQQAEIDLYARLLLRRASESDFSDIESFYTKDGESVTVDQSAKTVTVALGDGNSLLCTWETENTLEKWTVSYRSDGETVVSREYYYMWNGSLWQFTDPPSLETEDVTS